MLADVLLTAEARRDGGLGGVRSLELGCGAGLCSLVAALSGASVLATDGVADAARLCALSAARNGIPTQPPAAPASGSMESRVLDWFKEQQVPEAEFELVLGSDILFFRGCVTPVAAAIQRALRPGGFALISDPCRASVEDFCEKLAGHGLRVRLRYFDQARLAALPANEAAAAHDGFVQHWGQQRGRLIWAEKAGASVGGLREAVAAAVEECCEPPDASDGQLDWDGDL